MEFDLSFHLFCVLSDDSSMFYLVSDHIFSSLVYQYTHHRTLCPMTEMHLTGSKRIRNTSPQKTTPYSLTRGC
jgi:hypothetical protein